MFGYNIDKYEGEKKSTSGLFTQLSYTYLSVTKNALLEGNKEDYPYAVTLEDNVSLFNASLYMIFNGYKLTLGYNRLSKEYTTQLSDEHTWTRIGLGYTW